MKPSILIQVIWLLVTSKVGHSFLELIGVPEPELLLFKFVVLCRGFREEASVKAIAAEM